jgi:hypothetical protein
MIVMRSVRPTMQSCARAALGLALAACLLAVSSTARAGDDSNSDSVPLDTKIFRSIMHGLGLKDGSEAPINYHERPPLVIPPDNALPPPQSANAVVNNPAWPKDPDVARAKTEKQRQQEWHPEGEQIDAASYPLRPDQLTPGAGQVQHQKAQPGVTDVSIGPNGDSVLSPSQLGGGSKSVWSKIFHTDDNQAAKFTGEPPRVSLTEPPAGYQTPSPDQPYGSQTAPPPKADNSYVTRVEGQ